MKTNFLRRILTPIFLSCLLALPLTAAESEPPVTLEEDADTYILDNGIVTARVAKASGDLVSLRYRDREMLATFLTPEGEPDLERDPPGMNLEGLNPGMTDHQYGFWSHDAMGPRDTEPATASVTIDPRNNGGERAEVSVKGISNGRKMGTGPGAGPEGQFVADIEIRYTVERGESGVYTYSIFEHPPEYPFTALGEARFAAKLADFFDWMSISTEHHFHYPKDLYDGDKYIYTVVQSENPAFGWSSMTENVGLFFINASMEYMSGGPTKVEFLGHRDTNEVAAPTLLNYWRSSHYGGAEVNVAAGEDWTKVIGPFFIYANSGADPDVLYTDAKKRAETEAAKWPYGWVSGVDYPSSDRRATVRGELVLDDPEAVEEFAGLKVGLTPPEYPSPRPEGEPSPRKVGWQRDAKYYQFWTDGRADGRFEIDDVRPGHYTLVAFTDGVLGEFRKTDVTVEPGETLELGQLTWTPVRLGRELWEIGIPNRDASEFFKADRHNDPNISLEYPNLFPNDVHYVVGESDFREDWFFRHVPRNEDPEATARPYFGIRDPGEATPYRISFTLPSTPEGRAFLRLAICGSGTSTLDVSVNGTPVGRIDDIIVDGVPARHGSHGIWRERRLAFDANALQSGTNTLVLTVPAGPVNNGIVYDYLRLELAQP